MRCSTSLRVKSKRLIIDVFDSHRLYKKTRVIIHANLAFSMFMGQIIFVFGIDVAPKVEFALFYM